MVKIRVTRGGCGILYEDEHGVKRHALKTPEDKPFMCDTAQAERLVRLGVAAYITRKKPDGTGEQDPEEIRNGHLSVEDLEKWDFNDLRRLADDMDVKPEGRKKADYIAAIAAAEVSAGDEEPEDDGEDKEDDELPDLGAADPE